MYDGKSKIPVQSCLGFHLWYSNTHDKLQVCLEDVARGVWKNEENVAHRGLHVFLRLAKCDVSRNLDAMFLPSLVPSFPLCVQPEFVSWPEAFSRTLKYEPVRMKYSIMYFRSNFPVFTSRLWRSWRKTRNAEFFIH